MSEALLPPDDGVAPTIRERTSDGPIACRCGTRIPKGGRHLEVGGLPPSAGGLFRGLGFCSLGCIRAFYLETLSALEGLDSPSAETMVSDLRETYIHLASSFAKMLDQQRADWFQGTR